MEETLCDITSFRLYCTPPSVLALFDELPIARDQKTRRSLSKLPLVNYVLGTPLHTLVTDDAKRAPAKTIKRHLWTKEIPRDAVRDIEGFGPVASPAMTLLLMARTLSSPRLACAMYELCGCFSIYDIPDELKPLIKQNGTARFDSLSGWQQVIDAKGRPSSLWKRPPVVTLDQLYTFAAATRGAYGNRTFVQALSMVAGMTRSPFEAETALLLSSSRRLGGYGLKIQTNQTVPLSIQARKIYPHEYCEADIYLESPDKSRIVDIECQGALVHTGDTATVSDANRTTALESMGISVVQITYDDVRDPSRLKLIVQHVANKLGNPYPAKTARMAEAEQTLRRELPGNWSELTKI